MRPVRRSRGATLAVLTLLATLSAAPAGAQSEVLERYVLGDGGSLAGNPGRVNAFIQDDDFGGGTAQASVFLDTAGNSTYLHLRVWRHVPADHIVFALLVFGVEVRGYDLAGTEIFARELAPFSFGDSASGNWTRKLSLPREVHRWEISFRGNYE